MATILCFLLLFRSCAIVTHLQGFGGDHDKSDPSSSIGQWPSTSVESVCVWSSCTFDLLLNARMLVIETGDHM